VWLACFFSSATDGLYFTGSGMTAVAGLGGESKEGAICTCGCIGGRSNYLAGCIGGELETGGLSPLISGRSNCTEG